MFQFHYGSIKMSGVAKTKTIIIMFQFHYGSIKIANGNHLFVAFLLFQFHYGSIKITTVMLPRWFSAVSIPLWFD